MGQASFPVPLGFQAQVDRGLARKRAKPRQYFANLSLREKENKMCEFLIPRRVRYLKTLLISFSYYMSGFSLIEVASIYHLTPKL